MHREYQIQLDTFMVSFTLLSLKIAKLVALQILESAKAAVAVSIKGDRNSVDISNALTSTVSSICSFIVSSCFPRFDLHIMMALSCKSAKDQAARLLLAKNLLDVSNDIYACSILLL